MRRLDAEWDVIIRNGIASGALAADAFLDRVVSALKAGEAPEVYGRSVSQEPAAKKASQRKTRQ